MGVRKNRFVAVLIALVMVLTSAAAVFAVTGEDSPIGPDYTTLNSEVFADDGRIRVEDLSGTVYKVNSGEYQPVSGTDITGLSVGNLVTIRNSEAKKVAYRWVKTTTIKTAKRTKVTWKKVTGAKEYIVRVTYKKNGKTKTKSVVVKGTSVKPSKFNLKSFKGCKVRVQPVRETAGNKWVGGLSKTKKVK
jgi:hypothetical protein